MSKISKALSSDISENPLFIMLMFVLVIIIFLAIFRSVSPFLTMGVGLNAHVGSLRGSFKIEAFENQMKSDKCFVLFYAPWCGHCKTTKPYFDKLKESYKGNIKIISIDCDQEENKELASQQEIKGFPTIRYYPDGLNGQYTEYNGGRTYDDFYSYVSKIDGVLAIAPDNAAPVNYSN
jgi:protein disulfide-isomerase-like protein